VIDLAWPPGTPITGWPTSARRKEPGTLRATGILAGQYVAYVEWDAPRPGAAFASGTEWLDTVPLSAVTRRWSA
jgi:hypothetical protein